MICFTNSKETIDEARLLLTVSPDSGHGLFVVRGIPIRIEHNQTIRADEIQAASAGFRAEHEDEIVAGFAVKIVHHLRSLLDRHRAVESHIVVRTFATEFLEQVESLRVVGHQYYFVIRCGFNGR